MTAIPNEDAAVEAAMRSIKGRPVLDKDTNRKAVRLNGDLFTKEMMRAALRSAYPIIAGEGVQVKPLEWTWVEANLRYDAWEAQSIVSRYTIPKVEGRWHLYLDDADDRLGIYETADEAKAAAQADYEARILSALAAPPPQPEVAELVEAVKPFDDFGREIFSRNWNKPDVVAELYKRRNSPDDREVRLVAGDFFALRAALASMDRRG